MTKQDVGELLSIVGFIAVVFAIGWALNSSDNTNGSGESDTSFSAECSDPDIKGNISFTSGEKIYHEPGGDFYDKTEIDESEGEKWFCTTEEAEEAGWRASER